MSENAATSAKWAVADRPVEKVVANAYYEEEEDPELAQYLWDRKSNAPKAGGARRKAAQAPPSMMDAPPLSAARTTAPKPQQQRFLLGKVVELGFDEQAARRALNATGWVGLQEAVDVLLG
jgi:hypothetical protein